MELARPAVDGRVLALLQATTFHAGDFARVSDGTCRLHPQLARAVVAARRFEQAICDRHARWLRIAVLADRESAQNESEESEELRTPATAI
jgi:hypothetical protein